MKEQVIEWSKFLGSVALLVFAINTVALASFHIPSESMVPTLEVGDRVVVTKMSYGYSKYSVPFGLAPGLPTKTGRILGNLPDRGDVVVFKHTQSSTTLIKRVIGLPGDQIQMKAGQLYLNGKAVPHEQVSQFMFTDYHGLTRQATEYIETLPNGVEHKILEITDDGPLDDTPLVTVPEGHFFAMGDNRDMSADSRRMHGLGMVPVENLIGRAQIISFSLAKCGKLNPEICSGRRFLTSLR
ncbi:MAG: signal peptidase I [Alphaproteobacteria bacterium]|nr:MAG: signal peptidase I [Alphaproteobacteria bacterium]